MAHILNNGGAHCPGSLLAICLFQASLSLCSKPFLSFLPFHSHLPIYSKTMQFQLKLSWYVLLKSVSSSTFQPFHVSLLSSLFHSVGLSISTQQCNMHAT